MRRTDGELILLWTLPFVALIWLSAFLWFPGFTPPMSPGLSAQQVAEFYRDPHNVARIRYSMVLFNWFCVGLIPILILKNRTRNACDYLNCQHLPGQIMHLN